MKKIFYLIIVCCIVQFPLQAQFVLSSSQNSLYIDFSGNMPSEIGNGYFQGKGFDPSPTAGMLNSNSWAVTGMSDGDLVYGASNTAGDYARGITNNGGVTTGGIYSFIGDGTGQNPKDTCLWIQPTADDWTPGTITLRVKWQQSGKRLDEVNLSYNLIVRNNGQRSNSFNFSYSTDGTNFTNQTAWDYTSPLIPNSGTWFDYASRGGNITGLNLKSGDFLYLRWTGDDVSGSNDRDEFGLDDIKLVVGTVLPLNFISFSALNRQTVNYLNWQTAEEENVSHFEIQRSTDARDFRTIGRVDANELRERVNSYSYTDRRPEAGMNYYRIIGVDYDGLTTTSRLATARVGRTGLGVHATVQGQISSPDLSGDAVLTVYDTQGRMVFTHAMNGTAMVQLPEDIQNGVYLMVLSSGQDVATEKMILQR